MKIKTVRSAGFTLVEIMIVVAIIGLLATIAIPNFVRARLQAQRSACINNLRQLDGAKQTWALEAKAGQTAQPSLANIQPYNVGNAFGKHIGNAFGKPKKCHEIGYPKNRQPKC